MMRSPIGSRLREAFIMVALVALVCAGCTSSQTSSIDDEMLSETDFSDFSEFETTESSEGTETLENFESADNSESLNLDEFEFSDEEAAATEQFAEEDLELDFEDFETQESGVQAESDPFSEEFPEDDFSGELDELQAEDVVQTPEPAPLPAEPEVDEFDLEDSFADEPVIESPAVTPEPSLAAPPVEITDIRYLSNQAGGTVVVDANGPLTYETRFNPQTGQYVIEIENTQLPEKLKRPYIMKDFSGSFGSINAYQTPGENSARVVVQLKPGFTEEPATQVEGNSLVVVPPAPSASAFASNAKPQPPAPQPERAGPLGASSLEEFLMHNQKFYGKPISLQVSDASVRDVISFIAEESGANIVLSDKVTGNVSLKLRKIPWDQALVTVMRAKGLGYIRQDNVIRVATMEELRVESETAQAFLAAQKELAPIKVKVIPVNYANVDSLKEQVKEFLSKDGKVVVDARSNSILLTDREDVLEKVSRLIGALDIQPNQVLIEGKIVEASEDFTSTIGVKWGAGGSPVTLSQTGGAYGTPLELTPRLMFGETGETVLQNSLGLQFGTLDFLGDLNAMLSLAETDQMAKILSSPRIVTMNREKAEIGQTGEVISIVTIQNGVAGNLSTTENRQQLNLKLTVTPQITSDGSVIMDMDVIRQFAGPVVNQITQSRPINSRTAKTKVLVKNGETAVIGGIYQVDEVQTDQGVPGLKDIPLLGWLFKSRTKIKQKNELLIFLTPRILAAGGEQQAASL